MIYFMKTAKQQNIRMSDTVLRSVIKAVYFSIRLY